ncbi:MAG: PorV/PorQ family protein [Endomicrobium sp.]|jgi:tetratricopeptide (TPR) repeat protein|nr:PorV/PorQ family protein [Endomicrobium sp.]
MNKIYSLLFSVLIFLSFVSGAIADAGSNSAQIFVHNPNPVTQAMGDAGAALTSDITHGAILNPASTMIVYRPVVSISNASLFSSIQYNFLGAQFPTKIGNFGIAAMYTGYGDIPYYDNQGNPLKMDAANDLAFIINYSVPIKRKIPVETIYGAVGVNLKVLRSALADYTSEAFAADFGGIVKIPNMDNFALGAAYKNFGSKFKAVEEAYPLPEIFTVGLAYEENDFYNLKVAFDFSSQGYSGNFFSAGLSVTPVYFLTFRGGVKLADESLNADIRLGLGFKYQSLSIDYAYVPSDHINGTHSFNLSYAVGHFANQRAAYDYYLMNHYREGAELYAKKDLIGAREKFDQILSVYPEHRASQRFLQRIVDELSDIDAFNARRVNEYMQKAAKALNNGDAAKASKFFRLVLELDPENSFAKDGLNNIDEYTRQATLERERIKNKDRIEYLWGRSEKFYKEGEFVRAKETLGFILEVDPENRSAKDAVVNIDNQLSKISADKVADMFGKGMDLYNQGNFQEAIGYFEAVVIAAPHRRDAQELISKSEKNIKELEEDERRRKVEFAQDKVRAELYRIFESGLKYYERNNLSESVKYFRRAKEIADKYEFDEYSANSQNYITKISYELSEIHYKRGFEFVRNNDFESAAREYKTALSYNPKNTSAAFEYERVGKELANKYYEEGMSYYSRSDFEKARSSLKRALSFDPDKSEAKRALERLQ